MHDKSSLVASSWTTATLLFFFLLRLKAQVPPGMTGTHAHLPRGASVRVAARARSPHFCYHASTFFSAFLLRVLTISRTPSSVLLDRETALLYCSCAFLFRVCACYASVLLLLLRFPPVSSCCVFLSSSSTPSLRPPPHLLPPPPPYGRRGSATGARFLFRSRDSGASRLGWKSCTDRKKKKKKTRRGARGTSAGCASGDAVPAEVHGGSYPKRQEKKKECLEGGGLSCSIHALGILYKTRPVC